MKDNRFQTISLLICILLLCFIFYQNRQLRIRQEQLENKIRNMQSQLSDDIRSLSRDFAATLEESQQLIRDAALEPLFIHQEEQTLHANVRVNLKQWQEDTQMTLYARIGALEESHPMTLEENGSFTAEIAVPLGGEPEPICLSARISGGGSTCQEEVGNWGDYAQLLPLRNTGSGWDGPNYVNGTASSNFNIFLGGQNGAPGPIRDPHFQIFRNGAIVQTLPAVTDPYSGGFDAISYTVDAKGYRWQLACDPGDWIDIRFRCVDEFGLGYDFLLLSYCVDATENTSHYGSTFQTGSAALSLYWPE